MLSSLPTSSDAPPWDTPLSSSPHFDDHLLSKLRQHQITTTSSAASKAFMLQQHLFLSSGHSSPAAAAAVVADGFDNDSVIDPSLLKSPPNAGGDGSSVEALYNGFFSGSLRGTGQTSTQSQHFQHPQLQRERIAERMKALQELANIYTR